MRFSKKEKIIFISLITVIAIAVITAVITALSLSGILGNDSNISAYEGSSNAEGMKHTSSDIHSDESSSSQKTDTSSHIASSSEEISSTEEKVSTVKTNFLFNESDIVLCGYFPEGWSFTADGKRVKIICEDKLLGYITTEALPSSFDSSTPTKLDYYDTRYSEYGAFKGSAGNRWGIRLVDKKENRFVCIDIEQSALSEGNVSTIAGKSYIKPKTRLSLNVKNGSKKILIAGNSHLSTSRVGEILNAMLLKSDSNYEVEARAIANAGLTDFTYDSGYLNAIKSGSYGAVFQCGLYEVDGIPEGLISIKQACAASNTLLVVFPALNESEARIKRCEELYSDVPILNWKSELDDLLVCGAANDDIYINDGPHHSRPLAGYVGAAMIYRSLFGKKAPLVNSSGITESYIISALKDYSMESSYLSLIEDSVLIYK